MKNFVGASTIPDPNADRNLLAALAAAIIKSGETTETAAAWRLSVGTDGAPAAPDTDLTTRLLATDTTSFSFFGGGNKVGATGSLAIRRFPVATLADTGSTGNLQDGTDAACWTVTFRTNSPRVGFRVDGSFTMLSKYRFYVDGKRVDLSEPTAVASGRRWLVIEPGAGDHVIQMQGEGDAFWGGIAVLPGSTVAPVAPNVRAIVFGDSLSVGGHASLKIWEGWPRVLAEKLGVDDLWQSGLGGTGYLNDASGTKKTLPLRAAQDLNHALAAGPVDIVILAVGLNDLTRGDVTTAAAQTLATVRSLAPGAIFIVMGPYDVAAPSAPEAGYPACHDQLQAVAAAGGVQFIDLSGVVYAKVDAAHATAAGAITIADFVRAEIMNALGA